MPSTERNWPTRFTIWGGCTNEPIKDNLIKARALIADPARWTRHALARDAKGESHPLTHPNIQFEDWEGLKGDDPAACSWCAIGAVQHVAPKSLTPAHLLTKAAGTLYGLCAADVNDELGHDAVLAIYDHAIEAATNTVL